MDLIEVSIEIGEGRVRACAGEGFHPLIGDNGSSEKTWSLGGRTQTQDSKCHYSRNCKRRETAHKEPLLHWPIMCQCRQSRGAEHDGETDAEKTRYGRNLHERENVHLRVSDIAERAIGRQLG